MPNLSAFPMSWSSTRNGQMLSTATSLTALLVKPLTVILEYNVSISYKLKGHIKYLPSKFLLPETILMLLVGLEWEISWCLIRGTWKAFQH